MLLACHLPSPNERERNDQTAKDARCDDRSVPLCNQLQIWKPQFEYGRSPFPLLSGFYPQSKRRGISRRLSGRDLRPSLEASSRGYSSETSSRRVSRAFLGYSVGRTGITSGITVQRPETPARWLGVRIRAFDAFIGRCANRIGLLGGATHGQTRTNRNEPSHL